MNKNDFIVNGGMPAHPVSVAMDVSGDVVDSSYQGESGVTKREYFAGLAMQGLLANSAQLNVNDELVENMVKLADALLKELEK